MNRITLIRALRMVNEKCDDPVYWPEVVSYKRNRKSYTLILPAAKWRITEKGAKHICDL